MNQLCHGLHNRNQRKPLSALKQHDFLDGASPGDLCGLHTAHTSPCMGCAWHCVHALLPLKVLLELQVVSLVSAVLWTSCVSLSVQPKAHAVEGC